MGSILSALARRRNKARAEVKAAKTRAKAEVKAHSKAQQRRAKFLAKQEKSLLKTEEKGLKARRKHERKMADKELKKLKEGRFNSKNVSRYAGALRMLAPLALPLIYRGIVAGREALEARWAKREGVTKDELAKYSGHGAPLKARIDGLRDSLKETDLPGGFKRDVKDRLDDLDAAVDNAEYMSPQQRDRVHSSLSDEIDGVAREIQERL